MKKHTLVLFCILISSFILKSQIDFGFKQKISFNESVSSVNIADVTGDGVDDVITSTTYYWSKNTDAAKIIILKRDSSGTFVRYKDFDYPKVYPGLTSITVADINNDSFKDIIIGYADSIRIYYLCKDAELINSESIYNGSSVINILTMDVNNDNKVDIVVNNESEQKNIFYQSSLGVFSKKSFEAVPSNYFSYVAVEDINNDNFKDILFSIPYNSQTDTVIYIYTQNITDSSFQVNKLFYKNTDHLKRISDFAIGDINNDNKKEIIGIDDFNDSLYIWSNNYNSLPYAIKNYEYADRLMISDLNCDLSDDVIVYGDQIFGIYENIAGSIKNYRTMAVSNQYSSFKFNAPNVLAIGNLDNDLKKDLAMAFVDGVVIMKNQTLPRVNTIVKQDSIVTVLSKKNLGIYYIDYQDTIDNNIISCTDSFFIVRYNIDIALKSDTTFLRKGTVCGENYLDSTKTKTDILHHELSIDSIYTFYSYCNLTYNEVKALNPTASNLSIYPNPTSNFITIVFPKKLKPQELSINIVNLKGVTFFSDKNFNTVFNSTLNLDVSFLPHGVYDIIVLGDKMKYTQRFIKI